MIVCLEKRLSTICFESLDVSVNYVFVYARMPECCYRTISEI
jgi:hypothetical protein